MSFTKQGWGVQTLLDLQPLVQNIVSFGADRQRPLLPVLLEILGYLYWVPTLPSRWKHHCRRGKQSGRLVKLKVSLRNLLFSDQRMGCSQDCWGSQDEQYQDTKLRLSRYSTTTRCFYKWKYREFTTRSKPLKETFQYLKHTTSSVKHSWGSSMTWTCLAASGMRPLVFIDDMTADSQDHL